MNSSINQQIHDYQVAGFTKTKKAAEKSTSSKFTSRKIEQIGFFRNLIFDISEVGKEEPHLSGSIVLGIFEHISTTHCIVYFQLENSEKRSTIVTGGYIEDF